jgi:hypothetical protein
MKKRFNHKNFGNHEMKEIGVVVYGVTGFLVNTPPEPVAQGLECQKFHT